MYILLGSIALIVAFLGFIRLLMTQPMNMPDADNFIEQAKKLRGEK
jgi:hypothetical protein